MAFKENVGPHAVEEVDRGEVDVVDDCVEHEAKVVGALKTSVDVVVGGDTVKVVDVGFQAVEKEEGVPSRDGGNLETSRTYLEDMLIVDIKCFKRGRGEDVIHGRRFEG